MTPGQASERGQILTIDHPEGGKRYAAHVFDLPGGGIAWAEAGWTEPLFSGHAFHVLEGRVGSMERYPGWMLITADERDVAIDIADGRPDGDRAEALVGIATDLGIMVL
jgi:hypothetical protein